MPNALAILLIIETEWQGAEEDASEVAATVPSEVPHLS